MMISRIIRTKRVWHLTAGIDLSGRQLPIGAFLMLVFSTSYAWSGGGPENVMLVVNRSRIDSMTIANHYIQLRQIAPSNVLYLNYRGGVETIPIEQFRQEILRPIFEAIQKRKLTKQIDYIVYSSGFPYAIDFRADLNGESPPPTAGTRASITGLTYLSQMVLAKDTTYLFSLSNSRNNFFEGAGTRGFRSGHTFDEQGALTGGIGRNYYLSVILGYTDGRGNSVDEIVDYLRRGALADGSHPKGTIYLMKVPDEVRSQTRDRVFPEVAAALQDEGVGVRILGTVLPNGQQDIMGAVLGRAKLYWDRVNCKILPGAIVEHLTSFGGDLRADGTQTPFTETLRFGATGSSGTVMEPYALQAKFPHPWMHVHYVRGATLAEAFYQSIASPYQLLIAGDPLCRPWARIPQVDVQGIQPEQTVAGGIRLQPTASPQVPVSEFQLFVDGRLISSCKPGDDFQLDTTKVADGYHELRVVAIEASLIESQGRALLSIFVDNHSKAIRVAARPNISAVDDRVRLQIQADDARNIYVFHNRNLVAQIRGKAGDVAISPEMVGRGPIELTAVAINGKKEKVFSKPVPVVIEAVDAPLPAPGGPGAARPIVPAPQRQNR